MLTEPLILEPCKGSTLETAALQSAIDRVAEQGGGKICFTAGVYHTGSLVLKSNITLHLEKGALLIGSDTVADYPHGTLLYAENAENITLTGEGAVDGCGDAFLGEEQPLAEKWRWRQGWGEVPAYYRAVRERPQGLACFTGCHNVNVQGVTLQNSPRWTLHLLDCDHVHIDQICIRNRMDCPNADGVDIDGSRHVLVENCDIRTGDDAVVIKTTGLAGHSGIADDITVRDCTLQTTCNGLKIGTETLQDISNVVFERCSINSPSEGVLCERAISGISIEMVDGAQLCGVTAKDITINNARCPLFVRLGNRGRGQSIPVPGKLRDIMLCNIHAVGAILPILLCGIPGAEIENIVLENIHAEFAGSTAATTPFLECEVDYPEAVMFDRTPPAWGLCARHIKGLATTQIDLAVRTEDSRAKYFAEDVVGTPFPTFTQAEACGENG